MLKLDRSPVMVSLRLSISCYPNPLKIFAITFSAQAREAF
jgi:hypothetical protein